ncbi:MAG: SPOR domain-containing protein [Armatimonadota bacterium]
MASGKDSAGARLLASVKFWAVVAVLCAIVGTASYHFGRDYVGGHLHEMEVQQRAPEIKPQSGVRSPDDRDDTRSNPPVEAVVSVREREPTSREERRARRELEEPQDGAQLNAAEAAEAAADEEEADETETPASTDSEAGEEQSAGREGGYVVAAGAFADEANAKRQVQHLAEQGYQPFITTQERDGITYRRVNVGTFASREEAEGVQEKLTSEGFDAAVWSEG